MSRSIHVFCCNDVVLQESGNDGPLRSLREILQHCETNGMVDLELGGHSYSRPASVVQGVARDQLLASILVNGFCSCRRRCWVKVFGD